MGDANPTKMSIKKSGKIPDLMFLFLTFCRLLIFID